MLTGKPALTCNKGVHQDDSKFKGSPYQNHFIYEINIGKRRIRHKTTLNLNDVIFS